MYFKYSIYLVVLAAALAPATSLVAESFAPDLAECAALADDKSRLACFDALAADTRKAVSLTDEIATAAPAAAPKPAAGTPTAVSVPQAAPDPAAARVPLNDSVGELKEEDPADRPTYLGRLIRCEESGPSRRTVFYLENGQVWQQKNSDRLRIRDCETDIEITKDWIGFKLAIPSRKRSIRVVRVR